MRSPMPVSALPTSAEYFRVLPEIILTLFGTLIMFLEAVLCDDQKRILGPLSIVGLAAALWVAIAFSSDPRPAVHNILIVDDFATYFRVLVIAMGLLVVFSSTEYLRREKS